MNFQEFKKKYQKISPEEVNTSVTSEPLVSVCVQTYQHAKYIKDCLDGIMKQETNFPFEVLLGEDNSKDGTREICLEYAKKYPDKIRLFLHHRENNIKIGGQPTGRFNFSYNLYSAKGKYIALCESDDYWTDPLKLQKQVDFMEANPDFGICFHRVQLRDENKDQLIEDHITREVPEVSGIEELAKGNFIHTPSVMVRNDLELPDWFFLSLLGDWSFYMCMLGNRKIQKLDDVMAVYRLHSDGIWSGFSQEHRGCMTWKAMELVYKNQFLASGARKVLKEQLVAYQNKYGTSSLYLERFKKLLSNIFSK